MKSVSGLSLKEVVACSINQKLILQGVSWKFYAQLLKEFEDSNALHFAFDNGTLEIETPIAKHEFPNRKLSSFVTVVCAELEINCADFGSSTIYNKQKARGVDPDTSFYIQNEPFVRGLLEFDAQQCPPDLIVEVDVVKPSLDKLPIFAALNVPEIWLYTGERIEFLQLVGKSYREVENSLALPFLSSATATEFLIKGLSEGSVTWFRAVREWAQKQR